METSSHLRPSDEVASSLALAHAENGEAQKSKLPPVNSRVRGTRRKT